MTSPRIITIEAVNQAAILLRTLRMANHPISQESLIGRYEFGDSTFRDKAVNYLLSLGQITRKIEYKAPNVSYYLEAVK